MRGDIELKYRANLALCDRIRFVCGSAKPSPGLSAGPMPRLQ